MKNIISIIIIIVISSVAFFSSCKKEDTIEQEYKIYSVQYLLTNNLSEGRRFVITYKDPDFANKITEQYENIQDTFSIRLEAKSLDLLYLSTTTKNDTADYFVSIYVDSELVAFDSVSCNWQCEETFIEIEYPLP